METEEKGTFLTCFYPDGSEKNIGIPEEASTERCFGNKVEALYFSMPDAGMIRTELVLRSQKTGWEYCYTRIIPYAVLQKQ